MMLNCGAFATDLYDLLINKTAKIKWNIWMLKRFGYLTYNHFQSYSNRLNCQNVKLVCFILYVGNFTYHQLYLDMLTLPKLSTALW